MTIGKTTDIPATNARAKAQMILAKISNNEYEKPIKLKNVANPLDITVNEALQIYIDRNDFRPKQLGSTVSTLIYIWGGATKAFPDI